MSIQKAQEKYDNMLPDDEDYEHRYDGDIEVMGVVFKYDDGDLYEIVVPAQMWPLTFNEQQVYAAQADAQAYESWMSAQEERSYYDY